MDTQQVAVYGAGGSAREIAWLLASDLDSPAAVVCFIDDDPEGVGISLNDFPVMGLDEAKTSFPNAKVVAGIGDPQTREKVIDQAGAAGFDFFTVIHPDIPRSKWVEVGKGVVIYPGCILTTNIEIHDHVQINLNCTISHDVIIEEYVTFAPGVHVAGNVHIKKGAYLGTGANIINGRPGAPIIIGKYAVVGAGACVTKSVADGTTVVGVPAKPIKEGNKSR